MCRWLNHLQHNLIRRGYSVSVVKYFNVTRSYFGFPSSQGFSFTLSVNGEKELVTGPQVRQNFRQTCRSCLQVMLRQLLYELYQPNRKRTGTVAWGSFCPFTCRLFFPFSFSIPTSASMVPQGKGSKLYMLPDSTFRRGAFGSSGGLSPLQNSWASTVFAAYFVLFKFYATVSSALPFDQVLWNQAIIQLIPMVSS